jgi:hypothetical protein
MFVSLLDIAVAAPEKPNIGLSSEMLGTQEKRHASSFPIAGFSS